ncbi:DUF3500 domain-containing protein [Flavobacteriaceae bacterium AH-315-B10]|nr:DUF3500 domain-containing protein [Flavobacteriaceae bacterium AH-315-B10]
MKIILNLGLLISASIFLSFNLFNEELAVKFLNSLSQDQRSLAQLPFDDLSKSTWHFIPSSMWPRKGIELTELDNNQKNLVHLLLQSSLSESGYKKTMKIINLENVLLEITGDSIMRNPDKYSVAFYGNPEKDSLWSWSFEGHHLSLNFTILNGKTSIAPRFLGASPATIPSGSRKGERTLAEEEDLGFELINSLSIKQRKIAIIQDKAFTGIVTKNSIKVDPLFPVGIKYEELNSSQQLVFLKLLNEYLSTIPEKEAKKRMEKLKNEEMNEARFSWAGGMHQGEGHYYRIQAKSFLIEFDNSQNNANHIHTVWRDFNGDFGKDLIREHYKNSDHHKD